MPRPTYLLQEGGQGRQQGAQPERALARHAAARQAMPASQPASARRLRHDERYSTASSAHMASKLKFLQAKGGAAKRKHVRVLASRMARAGEQALARCHRLAARVHLPRPFKGWDPKGWVVVKAATRHRPAALAILACAGPDPKEARVDEGGGEPLAQRLDLAAGQRAAVRREEAAARESGDRRAFGSLPSGTGSMWQCARSGGRAGPASRGPHLLSMEPTAAPEG